MNVKLIVFTGFSKNRIVLNHVPKFPRDIILGFPSGSPSELGQVIPKVFEVNLRDGAPRLVWRWVKLISSPDSLWLVRSALYLQRPFVHRLIGLRRSPLCLPDVYTPAIPSPTPSCRQYISNSTEYSRKKRMECSNHHDTRFYTTFFVQFFSLKLFCFFFFLISLFENFKFGKIEEKKS